MPASPRPTSRVSSLQGGVLLCGLTVVLLSLTFPFWLCSPLNFWPLVFVALVPLAVCIIRRPLKARWLLLYYLTGVVFFLPMTLWLPFDALLGTIVLTFFVSLYLMVFALALHRLMVDLRVPGTFALPLAWLTCEFARTTFIEGGFPFFPLGNAFAPNNGVLQTPASLLLQSADLFGVWALTFLAATVNGFLLDLLRLPLVNPKTRKLHPPLVRLGLYTLALVVAAAVYGSFRLHQSTTAPGPKVVVIQESIPQNLKDDPANFDRIFESHLALTRQAIAAEHPDLVAWPETMVPFPFNRQILSYVPVIERQLQLSPPSDPDELETLKHQVEAFRQSAGAYQRLLGTIDGTHTLLLVGVSDLDLDTRDSYNTAVLLAPGKGEVERYAKRHLVPFGEYVPFSTKGTAWRKFLLNLTPLSRDYSLTPGKEWTHFELRVPAGGIESDTFTFATPICFEDIMPAPAREMTAVKKTDGKKGADFLINISNDGWFRPVELDLHLQACQLRAVENRIPIARSVNTGNSGFIDSCGRIVKLVRDEAGGGGRSIGARGWAVWPIAVDSRISLYNRVGDILPIALGIVTVLLVGWTFVRPRRGSRGKSDGGAD